MKTSKYHEASKAPLAARPRVKNVITIIIVVVVLVIIYNEAAVNFMSIRSPGVVVVVA